MVGECCEDSTDVQQGHNPESSRDELKTEESSGWPPTLSVKTDLGVSVGRHTVSMWCRVSRSSSTVQSSSSKDTSKGRCLGKAAHWMSAFQFQLQAGEHVHCHYSVYTEHTLFSFPCSSWFSQVEGIARDDCIGRLSGWCVRRR